MGLTKEEEREASWFRRLLAERIRARMGEVAMALCIQSVPPAGADTIARIAVEEVVSILEQVEREEEGKGESQAEGA